MTSKTNKPSPAKKSIFRKVSEWLHLWLGLISGIIVFVVCLTGGIWVWRQEVWYFTEKYKFVKPLDKPILPPSVLLSKAKAHLTKAGQPHPRFHGVTYYKPDKAVELNLELAKGKFAQLYLNSYTGEIVKDKREPAPAEKFFIFIRAGHRFFWLPQKIGSPLVGASCIIFLVILLTGLIWWYPKKWTNKTREKSFKIKWDAKWKRLNIDLHNVLGFYAMLFIMALTISGIVFTFEWFENGVYRTLTWKAKAEVKERMPSSDTTLVNPAVISNPEDLIWHKMMRRYRDTYGRMTIDIPEKSKDPYAVFVNFGDGTIIYNNAFHYYDQRTLKELKYTSDRTSPYEKLSLGEKVFRMNFDIHTGQILGLPTKIIAFFACIIGASLPVTGTIIWYNRKWGKKKNKK